MMKFDKFFEIAKDLGIEACEIHYIESKNTSFEIYHENIERYEIADSFSIVAKGIYKGKMGSASLNKWDKNSAKYLANEIVSNASIIEDEDPVFIFKGSPKYKKISIYNKDLKLTPMSKKIENAFKLEKLCKEMDERIVDVPGVAYSEIECKYKIVNSYGLNLCDKSNYYLMMVNTIAKDGEQTKAGEGFFLENDYTKLNLESMAIDATFKATSLLNGEQCKSGKYKALIHCDAFAPLVAAFVSSASAENVQKHTSLFEGKLNQKVASKKINIYDLPLKRTLFTRCFDDEGVATKNRAIIKGGILQTYLHNLQTAYKDGVEPTGNAAGAGSRVGISPNYLYVKPGKSSLNDLIKEINNGVFITSLKGLHAGLDTTTGNFSLEAEGFLIKEGEISKSLDVVIVSGNLLKLFNDIKKVANDSKQYSSSICTPSVLISSLSISGK